jgi:glycosyltransferase involved in cell wall biosynthesis
LAALVKSMGLQDHVRFPNRYRLWIGGYGPDYMAMMYNAADVFLSPSKGEGFGIPIIEAQACGAPVIVTDFSSMPELVRWGKAVPVDRLQFTHMDTFQAVPSVQAVAHAIVELSQERSAMTPGELDDKRRATATAIHDEYAWDNLVRDQWQPFLKRVLDDINGQ